MALEIQPSHFSNNRANNVNKGEINLNKMLLIYQRKDFVSHSYVTVYWNRLHVHKSRNFVCLRCQQFYLKHVTAVLFTAPYYSHAKVTILSINKTVFWSVFHVSSCLSVQVSYQVRLTFSVQRPWIRPPSFLLEALFSLSHTHHLENSVSEQR